MEPASIPLTIMISPQERDDLAERARQHGFSSIETYLRWLIEVDQQGDNEDSIEEIEAGIKQGFREVLRGEYLPLQSLWDDDDE